MLTTVLEDIGRGYRKRLKMVDVIKSGRYKITSERCKKLATADSNTSSNRVNVSYTGIKNMFFKTTADCWIDFCKSGIVSVQKISRLERNMGFRK